MIPIGDLTIFYNDQARAWQIEGLDKSPSFQTGAIGRNKAIKYAIQQAFPDVAGAVERLVYKHGHAASRGWAAAHLLVAGHVLKPAEEITANDIACVKSQQAGNTTSPYIITRENSGLTCSCPDFAQGGIVIKDRLFCKHILAFRLGQYLNWPLETEKPTPPRPRKEAGGHWRGRLVTRVNGRATRQQHNGHNKPTLTTTYANGQSVNATHQSAYDSFTSVNGAVPFNEEKLLSWYYGR